MALLGAFSLSAITSCDSLDSSQVAALTTLAGAGAGAAIGGNSDNKLVGALVGAGVGLLAGYILQETIVKDRSEYDNPRDYVRDNNRQLDNRLKEVNEQNKKMQENLAAAKKKNQALAKKDVAKQSSVMQKNIAKVEQDIKTAHSAVNEATPEEKKELISKIKALSVAKGKMEEQREELNSLATI